MLYEGAELFGTMGLFKLHYSQHWAPRASLSDTVVASSGNLLKVQYPRTVWLIHSGPANHLIVGLKAFPIRKPLDLSQNRILFNATYFVKNAEIV